MKALLSAAAASLVAASSLAIAATADQAMEEMKKCAVCKVIAEDPDLMESMTWECHKVESGMLCLMTVPKDKKEKFDEVHKKMKENIAKVKADQAAGKEAELCSFCKGMGELEQAGAKSESVDTKTGEIYMVTATDPALIAKIHAHADQAIAEQKEMEAAHQ
jgi:hypothetical protein